MIKDALSVIAGTVAFTVLAFLQKENRASCRLQWRRAVSRAAVLGGMFVSVVKLILFLTQVEHQISASGIDFADVSFSFYLLMTLVQFRPLLFGVLLHLVTRPFARAMPNASFDSAEPSAKPTPDFSSLSPREKEVARLAARGYSNAQIADELYISVATVKRHMATIFEKLGITSRQELRQDG